MAVFMRLLALFLLLSLIYKGDCACSLNDITISQVKTGKIVNGMTEYRATISNECICSQSNVKLDCTGFWSAEDFDHSILASKGNVCLVNQGQPIFNTKPLSFNYAWEPLFEFKPLSSQISCS